MKRTIVSAVKRQFQLVLVSALLVMTLLAVLPATLPHNLARFFSVAPTRALAASNPITTENAQPGSTGWQFDTDNSGNPLQASNHQIEGYASATSVNKSGQISFMVSLSSSAQYTMDVYRMGYYPKGTNPDGTACAGPCGGRLMQSIGPLNGAKQATCPTTATTTNFGLTECHWPVAYTLTVPTTWTTGTYLVKLRRLDSGLEQYMTFVVRDDSDLSDIVLSEDVTTWQAYNYWGGAGNNDVGYDLYGKFNDNGFGTSTSNTRAYAVSFDRPYLDEGEVDGAGEFMLWDYPMVRWLEAQGYNVSYATDVDIETNANLMNGHKAFINTGHDEYYSAMMRSHVQGFINAGVNVAFFSANNIYNQIRWANSSSGQTDRIVICYKDSTLDPTTIRWRDLTPPQPENAIVGVMQDGVANDRPYLVYDATSWIYAGTGLVNYNGTVVTSGSGQNAIKGIIGYEFDERAANASDLSTFVSFEPAGLQQVGHSKVPATDNGGVAAFSDATLYTASSGAIIFAAGTIQWAWGLDNGFNNGFCSCNVGYANSKSQQITANILNRFISGAATPAPGVSLSPSSLSFGNQNVNTTSTAQTVTLTNSGNAALTINSIALSGTNSGDFAQTNNCPISPTTLAASSSCTISATFTPTATGSRSASVTISDNASGSPHTVALSGTGTTPAPAVSLSPTSLSFGNQQVNTTSTAQMVTLKNSGTADLTISSIGLGGTNPGDFAQTNTCPISPSTLAAGASCTISVTFTPTATGTRSASVSITDNAAGSPQTVALSGSGTAPPAPAVSLSPTSLSFGNQNVNTTSAAQSVTLINSGNAALTISSISLAGTNPGDFAQTNTCPSGSSTLAAGSSCTISVTFTPTASGSRSATVSISDNASDSPQSVALSGTGVTPAPAVTLTPSSLSFGNQNVSTTSSAQTVTLKNSGTADLSISSIALSGTNSGDFSQTNTCPISPSTLTAGSNCTISVTFTPTTTGSRSASVSITDNASGSPQSVALSGTGGSSVIFSDGFESGSLPGNWTSTSVSSGNSLSLDSTLVHSGTASLKAVVAKGSAGNAYVSKTISGQSSLDVRGYYYLSNPVNWGAVQLMSLYAQGNFIGWVTYNVDPSTPTLTVYNGANNHFYTCSVPSLNAWHSLELQYVLSTTTTGSFTLWLDGTKACGATAIKTSSTSSLTVNQVVVGSDTSDNSVGLTVHVDDVVISKSYIGP
jgi:hypothetical protein